MIRFAIDAITGFSVLPLKLATWMGFLCAIFAGITLLYVIISWLRGEIVQGWTSLMAIVLVLGSAQLIMVGILGEYIGRLYMQSKSRPLFIIEELHMIELGEPTARIFEPYAKRSTSTASDGL
jgi:dolichol-phosphate mannosyltransferase